MIHGEAFPKEARAVGKSWSANSGIPGDFSRILGRLFPGSRYRGKIDPYGRNYS